MMQQVLIALRFYATETFERVIGDLFGVSVFLGAMLFTRINVKLLIELNFLWFLDYLADINGKVYDVTQSLSGWLRPSMCLHKDRMSKQRNFIIYLIRTQNSKILNIY